MAGPENPRYHPAMLAAGQPPAQPAQTTIPQSVSWPLWGVGAALVVLAVAVVYLPALGYAPVFDDIDLLAADNAASMGGGGLPYRPMRWLSYRVDTFLFGGAVWGYHATNVALHLASCLAIFSVAARLGAGPLAAAAATVVFAVHPLNVEVVTYISGRRDLLPLLAGTAAVLAWLNGRTAIALMLATVAPLAKESGLLFLPVLGLASCCGFGLRPRSALPLVGGLLLCGVAMVAAYGAHGPWWPTPDLPGLAYGGRVLGHYLGGLLFPTSLSVEYPHLLVFLEQAYAGIDGPVLAWAAVGFAVGLGGLAVVLFVAAQAGGWELFNRARAGRRSEQPSRREFSRRPAAFALAWMMMAAVVLAAVAGLHEPGADRHAYPFLAALAVAVAVLPTGIGKDQGRGMAMAFVALLVAAVPLGAACKTRSADWADGFRLWSATVTTTPDSARAQYNLARALAARGALRRSYGGLQRSLRLDPTKSSTHLAVSEVACRIGRPARARRALVAASQYGAARIDVVASAGDCGLDGFGADQSKVARQ